MDIIEFEAIGELVGGVAVIGSLIFVGIRIRASAISVQTNSTLAVIQSWCETNDKIGQDPELAMLIQKVIRSEEVQHDDIDGRLNFFLRSMFQ